MSTTAILISAIVILISYALNRYKKRFHLPKYQSVVSHTRKEGESGIYRNHLVSHNVKLPDSDQKYAHVSTVYDMFMNGLNAGNGPNKPFLGTRDKTEYIYLSYAQVQARVLNFGAGLIECGVQPKMENIIGIYTKNCTEFIITELAAVHYSFVFAPLYDTLGAEALEYIIKQTKMKIIVVAQEKLITLLNVLKTSSTEVKYVIKIGNFVSNEEKQAAKDAKVSLLYFQGVEAMGLDHPRDPVLPSPDDLFMLCYTSGTTGTPKGVMLSHRNLIAGATGVFGTFPNSVTFSHEDSYLSFLPLAHVLEQEVTVMLMTLGARISFFGGDVLKLLDDLADVKPTIFVAVPRLLNRVYSKVLEGVEKSSMLKKWLFNTAFRYKKQLLSNGIITEKSFWDWLVFRKISSKLGGKIRIMVSGAAPISPDVLDFYRIVFGVEVLEGYGQTEITGAGHITMMGDYRSGSVGHVIKSCECKLVDVPDMGYLATDLPNPRGEICYRGPNVFKGYYKLPDKTAETLDNDGWCHTGDVGMILPNGTLKIIDRKKNLFKLSQGEYISPEKIEAVYGQVRGVSQIFVHGESLQNFLIAVIVVDPEVAKEWQLEKGTSPENLKPVNELIKQEWIKNELLREMSKKGKEAKLYNFEQVKDIFLEYVPFSVENGLLTPSMKGKRDQLRKKYQKEIAQMYSVSE